MKITVDLDTCERYGHCCFEAPAVFQLDDDGELQYRTDTEDVSVDELDAAARTCPVQAITITSA